MTHDWQPIETAPKDGTRILAFMEGGIIETWWDDMSYGNPDREGMGEWDCVRLSSHGCGCCAYTNTPPTRWMPLPAAPQDEDA